MFRAYPGIGRTGNRTLERVNVEHASVQLSPLETATHRWMVVQSVGRVWNLA